MEDVNFVVGVGDVSLVNAYIDGRVLSATCTKINSTDGKPGDWWTVNLLTNGDVLQRITISAKCYPNLLETFNKEYTFGVKITQEVDKRGNVKNYFKIVFVQESEEI